MLFFLLSLISSKNHLIKQYVQHTNFTLEKDSKILATSKYPYSVVVFQQKSNIDITYALSPSINDKISKNGTLPKSNGFLFRDFLRLTFNNQGKANRDVFLTTVAIDEGCEHKIYVTNKPTQKLDIFKNIIKPKALEPNSQYCFLIAVEPSLDVYIDVDIPEHENITVFQAGNNYKYTITGKDNTTINETLGYFIYRSGPKNDVARKFILQYTSNAKIDSDIQISKWIEGDDVISIGNNIIFYALIIGFVVIVGIIGVVAYFAFRKSTDPGVGYINVNDGQIHLLDNQ